MRKDDPMSGNPRWQSSFNRARRKSRRRPSAVRAVVDAMESRIFLSSVTVTTVSSSLNPSFTSAPNNLTTFTATVTSSGSPVASGTVTFTNSTTGTVLAATVPVNASGQAATTTSFAAEGNDDISAQYNGNASFLGSSGTVDQRVNNHTVVSGNSFSDPGNITLNDPLSNSQATPYPAEIFVSGLTGTINTLTLTLNDVNYSKSSDIDAMLVGPGGQTFVFASNAGANTGGTSATDVSHVTLTLSDASTFTIGASSKWGADGTAGSPTPVTSTPFAYTDATLFFPAPAPTPVGASHLAAPAGNGTFTSVYGNLSPNGTWSLYVATDTPGDGTGSIAGGWSLNITENTPATVTNVTSTTANGTYGAGSVIPITVTFSDPVTVTGTPQLALNSGGTASFTSGSGTNTLTFDYIVGSGQNSSALDYASTSALSLNGGTIISTPGNPAILTLAAPGAVGSLSSNKNIAIDTTAPTITSVSSTTANGAYGAGATISITISFSKPVAVTGTPQLALNSGGTANFSSGSGTSTLTFTYTVAAGQNSAKLDYASTTALTLNGGTIFDTVTNPNAADLTLPAPGAAGSLSANKSIVIDTTAPTVTNVSSTTANGTYGAGATISITVAFSKAVVVTGTPQLALNSGGVASYSSGSGTSTLTFTYTVAAGQNANPLDQASTSALTLNGGTIFDTVTDPNAALLILPAPGATGSLGVNKDIVIDTTPAGTTTSAVAASATYSLNNQAVTLTATVASTAGTVNGGTITFTVLNGSTPVGVPVVSSTVINGSASATYTLPGGTLPGQYTIQAAYNGAAGFASSSDSTHKLTVSLGAPASISIVSGSNQSAAVGANFANPLVVVVKDINGNVIPGLTVTFTAPSSGPSAIITGSPAVTGANGQASVTAKANGIGGAYNVTASVAGVTIPASFNLTNTYPVVVLFDQTKVHNSGSTVPVTIEITDAFGNNIGSSSLAIKAVSVTGPNGTVPLQSPGHSQPGNLFTFDPKTRTYQFNLKTTGYAKGTYLLNFTIGNDPTLHSVTVLIR